MTSCETIFTRDVGPRDFHQWQWYTICHQWPQLGQWQSTCVVDTRMPYFLALAKGKTILAASKYNHLENQFLSDQWGCNTEVTKGGRNKNPTTWGNGDIKPVLNRLLSHSPDLQWLLVILLSTSPSPYQNANCFNHGGTWGQETVRKKIFFISRFV